MPTLLRALLVCSLLGVPFSGCARNPLEKESGKKSDGEDSSFILAQAALQGSARAAADLHQEAAADDRVQEGLAASAEPEVKAEAGGTSIGAPKGDPVLTKGTRPKSIAAGALLKSGPGLAKAAVLAARASVVDTLVLADSARGWIYGISSYIITDTMGGLARKGQGRDSLRFRWPHVETSPAVLSFDRRRSFDDGTLEMASAHDDDGDGLLSEAAAGKSVRMRREWSAKRGDTLWLSRVHTDHGQTTHFDSLGAGKARNWADTLKVGGRVAWWRKIYDADGDGFVATASAGGKIKIGSDTYVEVGGGRIRFATETHGPGPDGDYSLDADNERYAASSFTVNASGEDVNRSLSGDADGDGLLWSPAAGAVNRTFETTIWQMPPEGWTAYKDSAVKAEDGRVSYYLAEGRRIDGSRLVLGIASLDGLSPFGPADTVVLTERLVFPSGDPERRDSTVRTAHVIPGRLEEGSDDLLLRWSVLVHFNAASGVSLREESFVAGKPVAPGAEATAGSHVVEEHWRPDGSGAGKAVRTWKRRDFDKVAGTSEWKEVRNFAGGDSMVASGRRLAVGGGSYVTRSGKGMKISGWYDAESGGFRDTVVWVDSAGNARGRRVGEGMWKGGAGEYAARVERAGGGKVEVRVTGTAGADGVRSLMRVAGSDTARWTVRGDTVREERSFGGATVDFALARLGEGAWSLGFKGADRAGRPVIEGALEFSSEGYGLGTVTPYEKGRPKPPAAFASDPAGTVRLDDKPLP